MTMTFFFISKVLPFRDLQISLSFKGRISFPETFADLFVAILFLFRCCICIFFSRLCMRSHPDLHTPSHARSQSHNNSSVHSLAHATRRTPGPAHQGERIVPYRGVSLEEMNLAPQH